jgi:hypothetical protein
MGACYDGHRLRVKEVPFLPLPHAIRVHPAVIATPLRDGETVLLHLDTKRYYSLNALGGQIWRTLAAEPVELGQLPAAMTAFVAELLDLDLLQGAEQGRTLAAWPTGDTLPSLKAYPALAGITFLSGGGVSGPVVI